MPVISILADEIITEQRGDFLSQDAERIKTTTSTTRMSHGQDQQGSGQRRRDASCSCCQQIYGKLLDRVEPYAANLSYDSGEASLIRFARRDFAIGRSGETRGRSGQSDGSDPDHLGREPFATSWSFDAAPVEFLGCFSRRHASKLGKQVAKSLSPSVALARRACFAEKPGQSRLGCTLR